MWTEREGGVGAQSPRWGERGGHLWEAGRSSGVKPDPQSPGRYNFSLSGRTLGGAGPSERFSIVGSFPFTFLLKVQYVILENCADTF